MSFLHHYKCCIISSVIALFPKAISKERAIIEILYNILFLLNILSTLNPVKGCILYTIGYTSNIFISFGANKDSS